MQLSIIIPALNEAQRIVSSLKKICKFLDDEKINAEVIVVDDGSSDNTSKVAKVDARIRVISYSPNRGKGYAVRTGMLAAKGDMVLFTDADWSTPIEEYKKLVKFIPEYDVVIGSRYIEGSDVRKKQPLKRVVMARVFNTVVQFFAVRGIRDTQCGFKLFAKDAAKVIFSKTIVNRFGFDVEALFLAKKYGFRIKEVPVVWFDDPRSTVHPIRDPYKMFKEVLSIRFNDFLGRYKRF